MLRSVYLLTLRRRLRSLAWWSLGIAVTAAVTVGLYPSIRDSADQYSEILDQMPEGLRNLFFAQGLDLGSPEGYLSVELFSFMVPILFLVFAIGFAASTLAGEEQQGSLDLLLANPVPRRRVVLEKAAAVLTSLLALGVVLWASILLVGIPAGLSVSPARLASAVASAVLLGGAFGGVSLLVGASTGRRGMAVGVASAVAVGSYLLNGLAPLVEGLEPYRILSPFHWYFGAEPLLHGIDPLHALSLLGLTAAAAAGAALRFEGRDLAV